MAYTPENNPYIPGDPYSYDLKWIVTQINHAISLYEPLHGEFTALSADFDELHAYVMDYFANLDLTQEVSDKLDQMAGDGSLSALIQPLFDAYKAEISGDIAAQNAAISVLQARMDTFASLPDGSTAGDAELLDIRIAADGKTYTSAGNAVRGQFNTANNKAQRITDAYVNNTIKPIPTNMVSTGNLFTVGGISSSGNAITNAARARSPYLTNIKYFKAPLTGWYTIYYYNSTAYTSYVGNRGSYYLESGNVFALAEIAPYLRITYARIVNTEEITEDDLSALNTIDLYTYFDAEQDQTTLSEAQLHFYTIPKTNRNTNILIGSTYNASGAPTSNEIYCRTYVLPVSGSYLLHIPDNIYAQLYLYDSDASPYAEHYLRSVNLRTTRKYIIITIPEDVHGMAVTFRKYDQTAMTEADLEYIKNNWALFGTEYDVYIAVTDDEARAAFMSYMNNYANKIGMRASSFVSPSGLTAQNHSTPSDELKMALVVAGSEKALDIWSSQSATYSIGGNNARDLEVTSNVFADWLTETTYPRLGGKGGTLAADSGGGQRRKAIVAIHRINNTPVALAIMGAGNFAVDNMVEITRELCANMAAKMNGETPAEGYYLSALTSAGGGYAAVPVPINAGSYINAYPAADLSNQPDVLKNANAMADQIPASTTKTLTMLCALAICSDWQEVITLKASDIESGSGSAFYAGDKMTVEEMLRIMMSESSNTLARACARICGAKLLQTNAKKSK